MASDFIPNARYQGIKTLVINECHVRPMVTLFHLSSDTTPLPSTPVRSRSHHCTGTSSKMTSHASTAIFIAFAVIVSNVNAQIFVKISSKFIRTGDIEVPFNGQQLTDFRCSANTDSTVEIVARGGVGNMLTMTECLALCREDEDDSLPGTGQLGCCMLEGDDNQQSCKV